MSHGRRGGPARQSLGKAGRRSGGVYWHPCGSERKPAIARNDRESHKSFVYSAFRPLTRDHCAGRTRHADRPLRARHPAEHRHHSAALRLPRGRGPYHRAGRLSVSDRPSAAPAWTTSIRSPLTRHARGRLSRTGGERQGCSWCCSPPPRALAISTTPSARTTSCCSAANPPACPRRCIEAADARLRIPMRPGLRSINVAMAAAMAWARRCGRRTASAD